jgi:transposase-like protein
MDEQTQNNLSDHLINILLNDGLSEGLVTIAQILMNAAMLIERERHLGVAPHQHSTERNGHANGFKARKFQTSMGQLDLAVPQVRGSSEPFRTSLLEKGSRSDRALKSAIATMYVQGVSTRRVTKIVEELCGFEVSSGQVSKLNKQLDEEFEKWRQRDLEEMRYLIFDATYYKVRIDGVVRDCATLKAIGVRRSDGKRVVLGVSCALSEAEVHWREFHFPERARRWHPRLHCLRCPYRTARRSQSRLQRQPVAAVSIPPAAECARLHHQTEP